MYLRPIQLREVIVFLHLVLEADGQKAQDGEALGDVQHPPHRVLGRSLPAGAPTDLDPAASQCLYEMAGRVREETGFG